MGVKVEAVVRTTALLPPNARARGVPIGLGVSTKSKDILNIGVNAISNTTFNLAV